MAGTTSDGERTRRSVLGDAHVDAAIARTTEFDAPFQDLITASAWERVWARPDWSHRERSMVTIALLAALGHEEELAMHIRATARTGASEADIREALLHVAVYAGVPAANTAIRIARQTLSEMKAAQEGAAS
ncbi:MAG: 4-carboxymuconolactone decarboxylase [Hoeflea sp.]|uniref:4-carboxymuconolactone decarboxylase n=1 Tax=Hoeflea sp. TaxID=1940281 RepID=UPI002731FCF0|nr:4-carboxymuconolactone decarboxylase [Hoeflea sp.]MDP2119227.1 4-carboxymuconolactone decarboxylase [Hoeflea sp.]MDP3527402.1 4-carboxymuconolactone decarboxylase [Hoeflea sp.]